MFSGRDREQLIVASEPDEPRSVRIDLCDGSAPFDGKERRCKFESFGIGAESDDTKVGQCRPHCAVGSLLDPKNVGLDPFGKKPVDAFEFFGAAVESIEIAGVGYQPEIGIPVFESAVDTVVHQRCLLCGAVIDEPIAVIATDSVPSEEPDETFAVAQNAEYGVVRQALLGGVMGEQTPRRSAAVSVYSDSEEEQQNR